MSAGQPDAQPQPQITPAVVGDADWCASLMAASDPWITLKIDRSRALAALARPGTELFVAHDLNGEPLGFILLADYGLAGGPYIASICVAPGGRSRGIGSALLHFAEQRYHARGHLFLLVSSFNTRARALYLRHGFAQVGEIPDYVVAGHSELILHKRLA